MSFNENLKYYMECKGIQTKELADKTGLSTNTISSYLKTKGSLPDAEKAVKIAEVLGITVEKLVKGVTSSLKNITTSKELKPEIFKEFFPKTISPPLKFLMQFLTLCQFQKPKQSTSCLF